MYNIKRFQLYVQIIFVKGSTSLKYNEVGQWIEMIKNRLFIRQSHDHLSHILYWNYLMSLPQYIVLLLTIAFIMVSYYFKILILKAVIDLYFNVANERFMYYTVMMVQSSVWYSIVRHDLRGVLGFIMEWFIVFELYDIFMYSFIP